MEGEVGEENRCVPDELGLMWNVFVLSFLRFSMFGVGILEGKKKVWR